MEGRGFINAGDLKAGDEVRTADGITAAVESLEKITHDEPIKVYNFEVEDFHTYYVSEQKVLVHNTCAVTTKNLIKSNSEGITVKLKYKSSWTSEQCAEADRKVKALTEALTVKTTVSKEERKKGIRAIYKRVYGEDSVLASQDIDHIIDLQLGGKGNLSNLQALDRSVNRSLGIQIQRAIKNYTPGTKFGEFIIE